MTLEERMRWEIRTIINPDMPVDEFHRAVKNLRHLVWIQDHPHKYEEIMEYFKNSRDSKTWQISHIRNTYNLSLTTANRLYMDQRFN